MCSQLPPDLDQRLNYLSTLQPGWGDFGSSPPSILTIVLIRHVLVELHKHDVTLIPEIHPLYDGSIEFVFRDLKLYGSINDEIVEFENLNLTFQSNYEYKHHKNRQLLFKLFLKHTRSSG